MRGGLVGVSPSLRMILGASWMQVAVTSHQSVEFISQIPDCFLLTRSHIHVFTGIRFVIVEHP